jgi:hypothetical protein
MNLIKGPAQYAKFIAVLIGQFVVYLQLYGATWQLVPAVTGIGVALAVLGVPNAAKPSVMNMPNLPPQSPAAAKA